MASWETLRCEREHMLATVTLDRPKALNALNAAMLRDLSACFAELSDDRDVRVVLLTGTGDRAFAAGADIRELQALDEASGRELSERGQAVFAAIESCGKPVLACLNGLALGGGLELALACTLRLAATHAQLGLPEAKLGLVPGFGGAFRLRRLVGRPAALRLLLTAESIDAQEALRIGLIDEVCSPEQLLARARALAQAMAGLAPLAVRAVLELDRQQAAPHSADALAAETEVFGRLCATADRREGVAAFLAKRPPAWSGH